MALFIYKWMAFVLLPFIVIGDGNEKKSIISPAKHPFYISVTEVNHNNTDKAVEISCKFFVDDFEQTLEKGYKAQLDITAAKDKAAFDKYIPDYVAKHLSIMLDGKPVALNYIGFEKDKESAYAYFEIANVATVKSISITNSLLHDFTDKQINILHVTVGGKRQSTKIDYPGTKAAFGF